MITVRIYYSDGGIKVKKFDTKKEAEWYCHMEGDHAVNWEYIN